MRTPRPILFASALLIAAACSDGAAAGPTLPGAPAMLAAPTPPPPPPPTTTESDSVQSGYGSESTGGIEYQEFEYDPETGTETVVTSDPEAPSKELQSTTTSDPG
jgi:hypothetical protein